METLEYISELVLYVGGLVVVYDFLPATRRKRIDEYVTKKLTWKLLVNTLLLATSFYILVRFFPYIAPFALLIVIIAIVYEYNNSNNKSSVYLLLFFIIIPIALPWLIEILSSPDNLVFSDSDYSKVVYSTLMPYVWFSEAVSQIFGDVSQIPLPKFSSVDFENKYLQTIDLINAYTPEAISRFPQFRLFSWAYKGYLLIFAVLIQILLLVYLWYFVQLAYLSITAPLIRFSYWAKNKFEIEQENIPIAGTIIFAIASTFMMILRTIEFFG